MPNDIFISPNKIDKMVKTKIEISQTEYDEYYKKSKELKNILSETYLSESYIEGSIYDYDNKDKKLSAATILIKGTPFGAYSDKNGDFTIFPKKNKSFNRDYFTIMCLHQYYLSNKIHNLKLENEILHIDFFLKFCKNDPNIIDTGDYESLVNPTTTSQSGFRLDLMKPVM